MVLYYALYKHGGKLVLLIRWFGIRVEWFQKKCRFDFWFLRDKLKHLLNFLENF